MVSRLSFVHRQLSIRIIMPLPDTPRRRLDCCGLLKEFLHSMKLLLFVSGDDNTFRSGLTNFEAGRLWCRLSSLRQQPERLHHNTRASILGQTPRKRIEIFVDSPVPGEFTIPAVAYG